MGPKYVEESNAVIYFEIWILKFMICFMMKQRRIILSTFKQRRQSYISIFNFQN